MSDHGETMQRPAESDNDDDDDDEEEEEVSSFVEIQPERVLEPAPESPDHYEESKEMDENDDNDDDSWLLPDSLAPNVHVDEALEPAVVAPPPMDEAESHAIPLEHATSSSGTTTTERDNVDSALAPTAMAPPPMDEAEFHSIPLEHATTSSVTTTTEGGNVDSALAPAVVAPPPMDEAEFHAIPLEHATTSSGTTTTTTTEGGNVDSVLAPAVMVPPPMDEAEFHSIPLEYATTSSVTTAEGDNVDRELAALAPAVMVPPPMDEAEFHSIPLEHTTSSGTTEEEEEEFISESLKTSDAREEAQEETDLKESEEKISLAEPDGLRSISESEPSLQVEPSPTSRSSLLFDRTVSLPVLSSFEESIGEFYESDNPEEEEHSKDGLTIPQYKFSQSARKLQDESQNVAESTPESLPDPVPRAVVDSSLSPEMPVAEPSPLPSLESPSLSETPLAESPPQEQAAAVDSSSSPETPAADPSPPSTLESSTAGTGSSSPQGISTSSSPEGGSSLPPPDSSSPESSPPEGQDTTSPETSTPEGQDTTDSSPDTSPLVDSSSPETSSPEGQTTTDSSPETAPLVDSSSPESSPEGQDTTDSSPETSPLVDSSSPESSPEGHDTTDSSPETSPLVDSSSPETSTPEGHDTTDSSPETAPLVDSLSPEAPPAVESSTPESQLVPTSSELPPADSATPPDSQNVAVSSLPESTNVQDRALSTSGRQRDRPGDEESRRRRRRVSQQELDSLIRHQFRETSAKSLGQEQAEYSDISDDDGDMSAQESSTGEKSEKEKKDLKGFFFEIRQPSWPSVESRYSVPDVSPKETSPQATQESGAPSSSSSSDKHPGSALPLHSESTRVARGRSSSHRRRERKEKKKGLKKAASARSKALRELEQNVHDSMRFLQRSEPRKGIKALVAMTPAEGDNYPSPTSSSSTESSSRLLHGFESLLGALLQLSDELELWSTFARTPSSATAVVSADAIKSVLSHAPALNQIFSQFNPILEHFLETGVDPDSEIEILMNRAHLLVQLLCETTHKVCQRQEWNARAETAFVTLLELMDRTILEITCQYEQRPVPPFQMSTRHRRAWVATGHIQELKELFVPPEKDTLYFQHLCYDVLIGTDHWCPNTTLLGAVCNVGPGQKEDSPPPTDARLAPIPLSALYVLDNIQGPPLPRTAVMTRILRTILPPYAILDPTIVRRTTRPSSSTGHIISVTSAPEILGDVESKGMAGVGKSTVAALVASHDDVRRHFKDGVVWVHVGSQDLTYRRYTQCLRELCSQLVFYDGIPLFAELLHTPGETQAARTRREEGFMIYARDAVAELLRMRSVLIILDDVTYASDIDWFQFGPASSTRQSKSSTSSSSGDSLFCILVTTRQRDLLPLADTVEIDLLDDRDAMHLFVTESGHPPDHAISESREAKSVVMECANHPLAVKSVGRWMRLKEVTAGVIRSMEEIYREIARATGSTVDELVRSGKLEEADMMYEIMNMSFSPYVNGEPTLVIKFCFAAFVTVFCHEEHHSNFLSTGTVVRPIIPMETADQLFQTLLSLEKDTLIQEGSPFFTNHEEATLLIPEALSALGVLKVITSADDAISEVLSHSGSRNSPREQQYLQIIHSIQQEYGEYLCSDDKVLGDLTRDGEKRWNSEFSKACLATSDSWDTHVAVASRDYAVEMLVSHMLRGELFEEAAAMLCDEQYVRGRLYSLGPENATRRHIADCEMLFQKLKEKQEQFSYSREPQVYMEWAYRQLSKVMSSEISENESEEGRILKIEAGRANFEMGFSLAEKRCWKPAIFHWELSRKLLVASLGMTEFVAAVLFNMGVALSQLNKYEEAMTLLKQCLRIRGALHGEEHLLYAHTIQKIGDVFLQMSDFKEALESYSWAMEIVMIDSVRHRVDIGDILDSIGNLYYLQGEVSEALQYFEDALDSKLSELGNEDPELATTFQHIGNCLSDKGKVEEAAYNFEEAIRLMSLNPNGGEERDADVLSLKGVLYNLNGRQEEGLKCYERALEILMRYAPHLKKKIADLLHLIGCVYLINGEHIKAMKLFEESLHTRRKMMGFVHLDVASTLFNMAFLHQTRNHPKKALKCLEEALKIRQLCLPDSEKVAVTHEKIGVLAKALGKRRKAEIAFEEALRIRTSIYGNEHESVASLLQELGDLMDDFGEYEEAMTYYAEALDVRRKRLGADHESVASIMYSMGFAMYNAGRLESALHCFDEALIIWKSRIGTNTKEVADTLNMMGFLHARRGDLDDALLLLLEALSIRKFQKDHVKVSETLLNMGNVHREKQQYELAVECYSDCLKIRRSELGDDHIKVADALIAVGNVRSDMEHTDEALKAYEEALAIRSLIYGDDDEKVGKIYQHMGMIEFRYGDLHRARQLLEEFVRIRRKNGTDDDGEFVNILFVIGNIHKINGERYHAQRNWTEAYNLAQDLGITKRNPELNQAMNRLIEAGDIVVAETGPSDHSVLTRLKENLKEEKLPPHSRTSRPDGRDKADAGRKRKNL